MSTTRRSFLSRALAACAALLPAGLLRAAPARPRLRVTVNGVAFDDPVALDVRFDIAPEGATMEAVRVLVTGGGTLTVHNERAPGLDVRGEDGYIIFEGTDGLRVLNADRKADGSRPFGLGRHTLTIRSLEHHAVAGRP